jgi:hypothetical protein
VFYAITLAPFLVAFLGAAYLIGTISITLGAILILMYLVTSVIQAGCCVGCPYRGRYCPALFGVYLGNILSTIIYPNREYEERFFKRHANWGEWMVLLTFLYACYWLTTLSWWYVLALVVLIGTHIALYIAAICPKCGYKKTCPAGKFACQLKKPT